MKELIITPNPTSVMLKDSWIIKLVFGSVDILKITSGLIAILIIDERLNPEIIKKAVSLYLFKILSISFEKMIKPKTNPTISAKKSNRIFGLSFITLKCKQLKRNEYSLTAIKSAVALNPGTICVKLIIIPKTK